jgi:hypothetical protein
MIDTAFSEVPSELFLRSTYGIATRNKTPPAEARIKLQNDWALVEGIPTDDTIKGSSLVHHVLGEVGLMRAAFEGCILWAKCNSWTSILGTGVQGNKAMRIYRS